MASLLYGAGLRLQECCSLRVRDLDFGGLQIVVRSGKGDKDRIALFPSALSELEDGGFREARGSEGSRTAANLRAIALLPAGQWT